MKFQKTYLEDKQNGSMRRKRTREAKEPTKPLLLLPKKSQSRRWMTLKCPKELFSNCQDWEEISPGKTSRRFSRTTIKSTLTKIRETLHLLLMRRERLRPKSDSKLKTSPNLSQRSGQRKLTSRTTRLTAS